MPSGEDSQLFEMFGQSICGFILILLLITLFLFYLSLFFILRITRKSVNKKMEESFGELTEIKLIKNDNGLYDVEGSYKGRKIVIKHLTDVLANPKKMLIKLEHKLPNISEESGNYRLKLTSDFAIKELDRWPENTRDEVDKLIDEINELDDPAV